MQDVNHQLFCESVLDEALLGAADDADTKEKARQLMEKLGVWELRDRHPMTLMNMWESLQNSSALEMRTINNGLTAETDYNE